MPTQFIQVSELAESCGEIDLFVCSASFESRCLTIASSLNPNKVRRVLVAENMNRAGQHGSHPQQLIAQFQSAEMVPLDSSNPLLTADSMLKRLNVHTDSPAFSILIDITAFTHEAVLILFRIFIERFPLSRITFAYAKAAEYSIGDPVENKWLSSGVAELRSVLGYPGGSLPSRAVHFVALVGFEWERIIELIRAIEPSVISLGYSDMGPNEENEHHLSNELGLQMIRAVYGTARTFTFPVHDPMGTLEAIVRQVRDAGDYNTVLAPMNTKLSTLGAGLAGLKNPDIQLCYAQPLAYNMTGYSTPSNEAFLFTIDSTNQVLEDREGK